VIIKEQRYHSGIPVEHIGKGTEAKPVNRRGKDILKKIAIIGKNLNPFEMVTIYN